MVGQWQEAANLPCSSQESDLKLFLRLQWLLYNGLSAQAEQLLNHAREGIDIDNASQIEVCAIIVYLFETNNEHFNPQMSWQIRCIGADRECCQE